MDFSTVPVFREELQDLLLMNCGIALCMFLAGDFKIFRFSEFSMTSLEGLETKGNVIREKFELQEVECCSCELCLIYPIDEPSEYKLISFK